MTKALRKKDKLDDFMKCWMKSKNKKKIYWTNNRKMISNINSIIKMFFYSETSEVDLYKESRSYILGWKFTLTKIISRKYMTLNRLLVIQIVFEENDKMPKPGGGKCSTDIKHPLMMVASDKTRTEFQMSH